MTDQIPPAVTQAALRTMYVQDILGDMALEVVAAAAATPAAQMTHGVASHTSLCTVLEDLLPTVMDNVARKASQIIAVTAVLMDRTSHQAEWQLAEWCAQQLVEAVHQAAKDRSWR